MAYRGRGRGGGGGPGSHPHQFRVPYGDYYQQEYLHGFEEDDEEGETFEDPNWEAAEQQAGRPQHREDQQLVAVARDMPQHISEADLLEAFGCVGPVSRIWMMPQKRLALVEFREAQWARRAIELSKSGVLGTIRVYESNIPKIMHRGEGFPNPNRVLLLIIYREECPVTIETLHRACSQFGGRVCRIVLFRKGTGQQLHAMVEFAHIEQALAAKTRLNGLDIFDGCCTIKADFAQPTELTVTRNTADSWDFTREPHAHAGPPGQPHHYPIQHPNPQQPPPGVTPVLLISGLESGVFTCERLFNLLCLYGNVLRVCLLAQPPGLPPPPQPLPPPPPGTCVGAFVQMGDVESACRVGGCLDGARMFGAHIRVLPTGYQSLGEDTVPPTVLLAQAHDGSRAYADFTDSENNRYTTPRQAASNRPLPPFRSLYFWNCPPSMQEQQLKKVLSDCGCAQPQSVLRFSRARATEKSSGGMVQWATDVMTIEALVLANNRELVGLGQQERGGNFVLRLRFADRTIGQKEEELPMP